MPCEEIVSNCALFLRFLDPPLQCCLDIQEEPGPPSRTCILPISGDSGDINLSSKAFRYSLGGTDLRGQRPWRFTSLAKSLASKLPAMPLSQVSLQTNTLFIQTVVHSCIRAGCPSQWPDSSLNWVSSTGCQESTQKTQATFAIFAELRPATKPSK